MVKILMVKICMTKIQVFDLITKFIKNKIWELKLFLNLIYPSVCNVENFIYICSYKSFTF